MEEEEDLWRLKDEMEAAGFEVSDMIDHGFIRSIYAHDPNGIPIEFTCNVEGRDVREHPVMGDSSPSGVTREGSEPQRDRWPAVKVPTPKERRQVYEGAGTELFQGTKD